MIKKYFKANLPDGYMGATVPEPKIKLNADGDRIEVTATATVPTTLMRVLGNETCRSPPAPWSIGRSRAGGRPGARQLRLDERQQEGARLHLARLASQSRNSAAITPKYQQAKVSVMLMTSAIEDDIK